MFALGATAPSADFIVCIKSHCNSIMLSWFPHEGATERITWYGGESDILHHEVQVDDWKGEPTWLERTCQTLGGGTPEGVKELLQAMQDYYQSLVTD